MRCSECGHDMTSSARGWLCLSCGNVQANQPPAPVPATQTAPLAAVPTPAPSPDTPTPAAPSGPPPERPKSARRHSWRLVAGISGAAFGLGIVTAISYVLVYEPRVALAGYIQRLMVSKSFAIIGTVKLERPGSEVVSAGLSGYLDLRNPNLPQYDGVVTADGGTAGRLQAATKLTDGQVYLQLAEHGLISQLTSAALTDEWYRYNVSETGFRPCLPLTASTSSLITLPSRLEIPVTGAKWLGFAQIDGAPALHFQATLDNSRLDAAIAALNQTLSADCHIKATAAAAKDLAVKYEVWRGWSADRVLITINQRGSDTAVTLDLQTSHYGRSAGVVRPDTSQDAAQWLGEAVASLVTGDRPARTNVPPDTAGRDQKNRDIQRKTNLKAIQTALESYYAIHKSYPASLSQLAVKVAGKPAVLKAVPPDPLDKAPYQFRYTPSPEPPAAALANAYMLSACLEDASDVGADVINPVEPCPTATYRLTSTTK